jgi:hypothetical protein
MDAEVEAVARAIFTRDADEDGYPYFWDHASDERKRLCIERARAAITALDNHRRREGG